MMILDITSPPPHPTPIRYHTPLLFSPFLMCIPIVPFVPLSYEKLYVL